MKPNTIRRMLTTSTLILTLLVTALLSTGSATRFAAAATEAATAAANIDVSKYTAKIGFLYVGPVDDYGYNQAAHQGALYLKEHLPNVEIIEAENVPENAEAERVMEQMINDGATIIFPTSYGHLDPALNEAKKHPEVMFFHMGGPAQEGKVPASNLGTYFGQIWQIEYLSGMTAGKMSKSGKLGFVAAFPIPQVLLNMNAFELGAKAVNPAATTTVVFTGNWCDPAKLAEAANSLIDQGIDVITQHQDCSKPILEVADRRGAMSVGYHADASTYLPNSWLTGSMWVWGPWMTELAMEAMDGTYKPAVDREGVTEGVVDLAPFGPNVPEDVQKAVLAAKADIISGKLYPFTGPIKDQAGNIVIKDGDKPDTPTLESSTNYLIEGIVGSIPQ